MRSALAFLTPFGRATEPDRRTLDWFPLIGAMLGVALGAAWWASERIWPPAVAAALVVALDLGLTGLLHVDGLADSADGLLPGLTPQRRLAVMRDPAVGAFGLATVVAVLLLRFVALAAMAPSVFLLAGIWCGSRTAMAVGARALPYARADGGLASALTGADWRPVALYGATGAVLLGVLADRRGAELSVALALVAGAAVLALAYRRIGGFTGDVLGAAGVVGETVALVVAAARW